MSILQTIKDDQLSARKNRDALKTSLLTTLYSEAASVGMTASKRESTDKEVVKVIDKFIANIDECLQAGADAEKLLQEKTILQSYLPEPIPQLDIHTLRHAIANIIAKLLDANKVLSKKDMGTIMATLKADYEGQYDGTVANEIVKELLNVT